jgi:galactokinase
MAEIAWSLDGCLGARLTGAGFGGCTVNLVEGSKKESFTEMLSQKYHEKTGIQPEIYLTRASNGAGLVQQG